MAAIIALRLTGVLLALLAALFLVRPLKVVRWEERVDRHLKPGTPPESRPRPELRIRVIGLLLLFAGAVLFLPVTD
ncbi:hypothetical protein [Actinotalea sp. C106]|uniref:hypothetical protein n=1 Tax=Actinotalea sp. C106 TaxID=2908644 RepID=UPI002027AE13|nr:hypothetical protein [Actinotalea sp. C106]